MYEESADVDFTLPQEQREHADGYALRQIGRGRTVALRGDLTLVRNPSWDRATDQLRKAYADRIEIIVTTERKALRMVRTGDVAVWTETPPTAEVRRYESDPQLADRLHIDLGNGTAYLSFNLALRPLDDVHVRRAINLVLNKARIAKEASKTRAIQAPTGHILPDSLVNNLLLDYDAYPTADDRGDVSAARREMVKSRYDSDGDGRCDDPACRSLRLPIFGPMQRSEAAIVARDLRRLGIGVSIEEVDASTVLEMQDPREHTHLFMGGWLADYLNASTFFVPLFDGHSIRNRSNYNHSLMGATPAQLRTWGYRVTTVPGVDDVIADCLALMGASQIPCWAEADQWLMENVVPWAPLFAGSRAIVVSDQVAAYSFAQVSALPALDRIALDER
jgi:ABC-type transport system substrate-binding protein